MALTPAEKMRAYRKRQREEREKQKRLPEGDLGSFAPTRPFFEWAEQDSNMISFTEVLDMAGIDAPFFEDDRGGKSRSGYAEADAEEGDAPLGRNSLERAEVMVSTLIDAAATLALVIKNYKRHEIKERIEALTRDASKIEGPDSPVLNEILQLRRMLDTLEREVRWTFPRWKVGAEKA